LSRTAYLEAAAAATGMLRDPAVAARWDEPSALKEFSVRGLAGHLARQVVLVPVLLALDPPDGPPLPLAEHHARSHWIGADLNSEVNVTVRAGGEREAEGGAEALATATEAALDRLREALPALPADRLIHVPWGPWTLTLDDFLVTRMLEIAVHCDDLAVSVGMEPPALPPAVLDPVLSVLCAMAVRRHGATAVLRALSRAERAPATIAAI
jgi:hypothetical protein